MPARHPGAAAAVMAAVPLAVLVALGALSGLHHDTGSGTVDTATIVLVQGGFGGGAVLLHLIGAALGWRELGGRPAPVSPLVPVVGGAVVSLAWIYVYVAAYGS